ncbi:MAG TPA: protein phosphatase 2C domain-containing protein [Paucimonas sp.]|nr:protein phosphatase 2C domain-containing protein [Paucimonas sp.]
MALTEALQIASLTDPGQLRERNEDSIGACPETGLVVLADGMGGYNAGGVASGMAVSTLVAGVKQAWPTEALKSLDRAAALSVLQSMLHEQIGKTNAAIHAAAQNDPACAEMGTTLVAGLFYDDTLIVAHAGDSRLYRLRNDILEQLTHDHSLLQEQIDAGMIRKEDAHLSNNKNLVTRALGVTPEEEGEIRCHDVLPGDIFLLCSDGLHGMIADDDIEMTVAALKANLELTAQQLVQAANDAGGSDNVSVILVRVSKSFAQERTFSA